MTDPDRTLEAEINLSCEQLIRAQTTEARRAAFEQMKEQISRRSPQQIERMERARGLRP